jgi:hypothetical protein
VVLQGVHNLPPRPFREKLRLIRHVACGAFLLIDGAGNRRENLVALVREGWRSGRNQ